MQNRLVLFKNQKRYTALLAVLLLSACGRVEFYAGDIKDAETICSTYGGLTSITYEPLAAVGNDIEVRCASTSKVFTKAGN